MPDLTPDIAELERLIEHDEVDGSWLAEETTPARCATAIFALLAEREKLRAERDELLQRCGQAIAFVQTGGPLFTKDRLELLAILYHAAADGAEGATEAAHRKAVAPTPKGSE